MAQLSSHTLNIHHGPESRTISLLFDADKTSQIEPVSKVKKTKLCIKETLKEKVPRKWFCAGCSPVDRTAAGKTRACRHPAFRRNNILKASSVKSVYVITSDLKSCRTTCTGSLGLCHYCTIIVPFLYHYWDFYPVTLTCSKKSKRAEQNFGWFPKFQRMTPFHLCKVRSRSNLAKTSNKVSNANIWLVGSASTWKQHKCGMLKRADSSST